MVRCDVRVVSVTVFRFSIRSTAVGYGVQKVQRGGGCTYMYVCTEDGYSLKVLGRLAGWMDGALDLDLDLCFVGV